MRRPVEDPDRVLLLDRIEQTPAPVRVAGAAHVLDDLDVAALGEVVVGAAGRRAGRRRGGRAGAARAALALAVRGHRQQHRERPSAGCAGRRRRIDLVDPDRRAAGALDRDVVDRRGAVDRFLGLPVATRRGAGSDDARRQLGVEPDQARRGGLDRRRAGRRRRDDRRRRHRDQARAAQADSADARDGQHAATATRATATARRTRTVIRRLPHRLSFKSRMSAVARQLTPLRWSSRRNRRRV